MTEHPPPPSGTVGRRRARRLAAPLVSLVLAAGLAACTSESTPAASRKTDDPEPTAAPFELSARVTRVAGRLPQAGQERLAQQVGEVVSSYLDEAFLSPEGSAPFAGFSRGARTRAMRDRAVLTRAGLGEVDAVTAPGASAYLAVLAPKGDVVGVTARVEVDLRVTRGEDEQVVPLRGRLMLSPTADGWRIFGYDLSRADVTTLEGQTS